MPSLPGLSDDVVRIFVIRLWLRGFGHLVTMIVFSSHAIRLNDPPGSSFTLLIDTLVLMFNTALTADRFNFKNRIIAIRKTNAITETFM